VSKPLALLAGALCIWFSAALPAPAAADDQGELSQTTGPTGKLLVTVVDESGAILAAVTVTATGQNDSARTVESSAVTSEFGVATFEALAIGEYTLRLELSGFEPAIVRDVRVRTGENRRVVTLPLRVEDEILVQDDPLSVALEVAGPSFSTILTREQIDALPDDPEEMALVLESMAPPGAVIMVDGFMGGELPPKSLIKSIRIPRMDEMAAQYHGSGGSFLFIRVETQPGTGPPRGSVNATFFDEALVARNPFVPEKGAQKDNGIRGVVFGALVPNRTSFSLNVGTNYRYTSPNLLAVKPDGTPVAAALQQPTERRNFGIRIDQALTEDRLLRVSLDGRLTDAEDLGIGGYNLPERAYSQSTRSYMLRLHERGPVGQKMYSESRLQLLWNSWEKQAALEQPTIVVNDAFTAGGAQVQGGQDTFEIEAASDLDYVRGSHSWRLGGLFMGGRYRSNDFSNYLGTYTFASLDDFNAGKPSNFSRRTGDPNVTYSLWQLGLYLQDDWRVARSVMVSAGVRAGFQNLVDDPFNVSPRLTVNWAPLGDGSLTVRTAYGYLYDWIPGSLYKQALLFDGYRQRQINVPNPPFPEAPPDGVALPTDVYLWSDHLPLNTDHRLILGVERKLTDDMKVNVAYTLGWGRQLLRGRNLNTPVNGVRPDPQFANEVEMVPDAESKAHRINVGWNFSKPNWKQLMLFVNYNWRDTQSNTAGAFAMPPEGDNVDTEWGPLNRRHTFNFTVSIKPAESLSVFLTTSGGTGAPYNITTGHDDNLDGVFNDRPPSVSRNAAQTDARLDVSGRVAYTIRMGPPRDPESTVQRYGINLTLNFANLFNRDNYIGYSGVMTSPFFMLPTNVETPLRVWFGLQFSF